VENEVHLVDGYLFFLVLQYTVNLKCRSLSG